MLGNCILRVEVLVGESGVDCTTVVHTRESKGTTKSRKYVLTPFPPLPPTLFFAPRVRGLAVFLYAQAGVGLEFGNGQRRQPEGFVRHSDSVWLLGLAWGAMGQSDLYGRQGCQEGSGFGGQGDREAGFRMYGWRARRCGCGWLAVDGDGRRGAA